jgi:dolichol-phosphate mannosyltransferase
MLISVIVPCYNEEATVDRAYQAISAVLRGIPGASYEILFSDNHSTDRTFERLSRIAAGDSRVRVIRYSRNFGYHRSVLYAYQQARGDCAVQVDCDLQDPPELIPEMLAMWQQGHQVVYGIRRSLPDGVTTAFARRLFYRLIRAMSDDDLPLNAGEFRLVDRRILDELRGIEDTTPYVRGLISAMGFSQVGILYDRQERIAGESKFPLRKMVSMAADGLLNHSLAPLRFASAVALIVGAVTFLLLIGYLGGRLLFGADWPAGFATTTLLLLLSITLNAMCFGILGEYVGRMFQQTKRRPLPIVEQEINSAAAAPSAPPAARPGTAPLLPREPVPDAAIAGTPRD